VSSTGHAVRPAATDAWPHLSTDVQGYLYWIPTILILLAFEVMGAITSWFGNAIPWPTLSMTVGHLEKLWDITAIVVVGVIAAALYYTLAHKGKPPEETRGRMLRLAGRDKQVEYFEWYGAWIPFGGAALALAGCLAVDADTYEYGYAIYGTLLGLGFLVPGLLLTFWHRAVGFPTLFVTARTLQKRWHFVAPVLTVGLTILAVHLAFYPWPDISHESATFAGRNADDARSDAEQAVRRQRQGKSALVYQTQTKGVLNGFDTWYVYFSRNCVVTLTRDAVTPSADCSR
jgi:membrane protein implicated in regulation of membrane protease activity